MFVNLQKNGPRAFPVSWGSTLREYPYLRFDIHRLFLITEPLIRFFNLDFPGCLSPLII